MTVAKKQFKNAIMRVTRPMVEHNLKLHNIHFYEFKLESATNSTRNKDMKDALAWVNYVRKEIVLNEDHIEDYTLESIADSILHECAHAMAYELHRETGHGKFFRHYCRRMGANPRAKSNNKQEMKKEAFDALMEEKHRTSRWAMVCVNRENKTYELLRYFKKKPKAEGRFRDCVIRGRDEETLGNLYLVHMDYIRKDDSYDTVMKYGIN